MRSITIALLLCVTALPHCTRRLDSHRPGTGLLIAQVQVRILSSTIDAELDLEYLLIEKDSGETSTGYDDYDDGVYVFNDVTPGRYRLYRGFVRTNNLPGENVGGVRLHFHSRPENDYVEALPGTIISLGSYDITIEYSMPIFTVVPSHITFEGGPGPEAQREGLDLFIERWPEGYWPDLARMQRRAAY